MNEEERFTELALEYSNGNISVFKGELTKMTNKEVVRFLDYVREWDSACARRLIAWANE